MVAIITLVYIRIGLIQANKSSTQKGIFGLNSKKSVELAEQLVLTRFFQMVAN